jgi:hypothetical protein
MLALTPQFIVTTAARRSQGKKTRSFSTQIFQRKTSARHCTNEIYV